MQYEIGDRVLVQRDWPWPPTEMTVANLIPARQEICLQADHEGAGIWTTHERNSNVTKLSP